MRGKTDSGFAGIETEKISAAWSKLMFLRCKNLPLAKLAPLSRWSTEEIKCLKFGYGKEHFER